ncbi:NAD-glutamate dehydrogenase [Rubrobacter aplysinae]|uniref:NAD-glutamate dehydrogenase n=1 Tax=Rubrobacter aplysinae TaxID=909625 RepID=UPI00064BC327|nr:NAD-glutamate dehydrogenase [Rubrobacter aplysinae]
MTDRAGLIEGVTERARRRLEEDHASRFEEFAELYYGWVSEEDLAGRPAVDLYGAALSHWNLASCRAPAQTKVRVYTPHYEEHGWQSSHTVIEVVVDDMPFLVDSVGMELNRLGYSIHLMMHPVVRVVRDESGRLEEVLPPESERGVPESVMHVEVDQHSEAGVLDELRDNLERVLGQVRVAVEDWSAMRERVREIVSGLPEGSLPVDTDQQEESREFLEWMENDHFTFLGYRDYDLVEVEGEDALRQVEGSGLGILRQDEDKDFSNSFAQLPPEVRRLAREPYLLNLTKANSRSTVHRPAYLDYVGVKRFDAEGNVTGERRFLGLYTSSAYSTDPRNIPLVRRKIDRVLENAALPPGSHYEKALVEIFESYPRDELFQTPADELYEISTGILHLQERQRVRLFVRRDLYGRFFSCLVYVPRDRYDTAVRHRIQEILRRALDGSDVESTVHLSESVLARLHFVVHTDPTELTDSPDGSEPPEYDARELEGRIFEASRSWADNLHRALIERRGEEKGVELFGLYRDAFPAGYREDFLVRTAVTDIGRIEDLASEEDLGMGLYHPLEAPEDFLRFKLFRRGEQVSLSEVLPLLEDMGVEVVDQRPYRIEAEGRVPVWIYDFGLSYEAEGQLQTGEIQEIFQEAFARAWQGEIENDGFNRLVLGARLTWREASILRAYHRYLRQGGGAFSQSYVEETLAYNPEIARSLVRLFQARFDPARNSNGGPAVTERLESGIEASLENVTSLDEDRILRSLLTAIQATLRTNYYQTNEDGEPKGYLSFKLDPQKLPELPKPRPMYEIFVYSPRMEGVHLRGGRVARGGIRWSDRREDFRTEILDLMKAQMVKNAVIVPVGAKGGFVVKNPPPASDREAVMNEGVECYRTLIRGMLDLTDNLEDGETVPPPAAVRHDSDDTYIVAAADKGTATFSDIANEISVERGFWLGDAFASGGSSGYDHKSMGITARGAWESVKRHFRELGTDVQNEDFTVVGVGDMAGDVFGNGMLLSRHIKLVGAFNHRHIFLDPDPDPEQSYAERERLFNLPRSSWGDYDESLISEGGGVFSRDAKSVQLSRQIKELLDVEADSLAPNEVIRALISAPSDLFWNGGIGTYVKSSAETHAEVGDKGNDAVRVDGRDLRCRVVGEGGNLGFTQQGRIQFALSGGRIYTDAIDNSAGVDCSDHEVNIKILLGQVVAAGEMTVKQRDRLLSEMTEEVAELVLRDNYLQTRAISNSLAQSASMAGVHARYIRELESQGRLDRSLENLPGDEEFGERKSDGTGLTAPELAILLSYSKITLYEELLDSDLPEDPYLSRELERYFPSPLEDRYEEEMREHRLSRELVATQVVNSLVNRAGSTFAFRLSEENGASAPEIARSYTVAREVFGMRRIWADIEELDARVPAETQTRMLLDVRRLLERATRWLLRNRRPPMDIAETVEHFAPGAQELTEELPKLLLEADREALERSVEALTGDGVPEELARRIVSLNSLFSALDIVDVATSTGRAVSEVAAVYFTAGDRLWLHWLRERIDALPRQDRWQTLARAALRDDLYSQQISLTAEVLRSTSGEEDESAADAVEAWIEARSAPAARAIGMLSDIRNGGVFDLSTLSVALREIRNLSTTSGVPETAEEAKGTS